VKETQKFPLKGNESLYGMLLVGIAIRAVRGGMKPAFTLLKAGIKASP